MSLAELLPVVRSLPHQDKVSLLQFLANSLAQEAGLPQIKPGDEFPIWSPYSAFAAAETLQQTLEAAGKNQ
jgi:hypothetical protein